MMQIFIDLHAILKCQSYQELKKKRAHVFLLLSNEICSL